MKLLYTFLLTTLFYTTLFGQSNRVLKQKIEQSIATKKAIVSVAIYAFEDKDTLSVNGNYHAPMQSVFKFHIALAVLHDVDKGKFKLDQKIHISKADLIPDTWSPIREKYPEGNIDLPLSEIIQYTVSQSDNNGCDILLRLMGGTKRVNDYIHAIGIKNIAIQASEAGMRKAWSVQYTNWTTALASTELLKMFYNQKILSASSYDFLWKTMLGTTTGKDRLRGQLPENALVAHKTGTSDTNAKGITAARNDIGIIILPNGKHIAISVFVTNSKENEATNAKIISDIGKLTWDYFQGRK